MLSSEEKIQNNNKISKIDSYNLQSRLFEAMKSPDFNPSTFATQLQKEGFDISHNSIRRYMNNTKEIQKQIISSDLQVAEQVKKITIDYTKALKSILDEVEEVKNTAKTEKDFVTYNQLVGRLMQGIELIAKLSGDMNPKSTIDINIVYKQINEDVEKNMKNVTDSIKDKIIDIDADILEEDMKTEQSIKQGEINE